MCGPGWAVGMCPWLQADVTLVPAGRQGALARTRFGQTITAAAETVDVQQVQGAGAAFSADSSTPAAGASLCPAACSLPVQPGACGAWYPQRDSNPCRRLERAVS